MINRVESLEEVQEYPKRWLILIKGLYGIGYELTYCINCTMFMTESTVLCLWRDLLYYVYDGIHTGWQSEL